jgi:hypothetical protein
MLCYNIQYLGNSGAMGNHTVLAATAALMLYLVQPVSASERELGAHMHSHGTLNIAIEGRGIWIELEAPGADIVGFEHRAASAEDRAAVAAGKKQLGAPLSLFRLPAAAGCVLQEADVVLEGALAAAGEHSSGHASDHDEHHDEGQSAEASHSAFHAEYSLICANPERIDSIGFDYFDLFPGAVELDVNLITDRGQSHHEVERAIPRLEVPR